MVYKGDMEKGEGMGLRDWIFRERGNGGGFQLPYLFSYSVCLVCS